MATRSTSEGGIRATVVGLGETGLACARYLSRSGYDTRVVDTRADPPGLERLRRELPGLAVATGPLEKMDLGASDLLVVSPGIPIRTEAIAACRAAGVEVVGDIELFARAANAPVVAVTGSNGKSTVTALAGMLAKAGGLEVGVGGNIGTPVLDLLPRTVDAYVLELSSFQLETTWSLSTRGAALLNLSEDHLDRYRSMAEYAGAKARIFLGTAAAVIPRDDVRVVALATGVGDVVSFGLDAPSGSRDYGVVSHGGEAWIARGEEPLAPCASVLLPGTHNVLNAMAALALVERLGVDPHAVAGRICEFRGLPHRCEPVGDPGGVCWINDSKGTNVGATIAAIQGMPGPVVLIAGGQGKGQDFAPLVAAARGKVRRAVLIGEDADRLAAALEGAVGTERVADLAGAVEIAARSAGAGDTVLFSPACASFDMFASYVARGDEFRRLVQERDR